MSAATSFITAVPVFNGQRGNYYIYDGAKYDCYFPLAWAMNHKGFVDPDWFQYIGSGPRNCGNCAIHGSINGVFVGYCSNCLREFYPDNKRGYWDRNPGSSIQMLTNEEFWAKYPYMTGVELSNIGDQEEDDPYQYIDDLRSHIDNGVDGYDEQKEQDDDSVSTHSSMPELIDVASVTIHAGEDEWGDNGWGDDLSLDSNGDYC